MEKETILILIIILLCIPELIVLLIFQVKYLAEFTYHDFMEKLSDKLGVRNEEENAYFSAFEDLFNRYSDSSGLDAFVGILKTLIVFIIIFVLLLLVVLFQVNCCCKQKDFLRFILSIIFLVICFGLCFVYVAYAFEAKYEIKLSDDKIYIFDNDFNKEIKDNLDLMKERRTYLITCSFLAVFFFLCQIVLVILKEKFFKKENNDDNVEKVIGVAQVEIGETAH